MYDFPYLGSFDSLMKQWNHLFQLEEAPTQSKMSTKISIATSYPDKTVYTKTDDYTGQIRTFGVAATSNHALIK